MTSLVRKIAVVVLLAVLAVGANALDGKKPEQKASKPLEENKKEVRASGKKLATHYFQYNGNNNNDENLQVTDNWDDLGENPISFPCNETNGVVCIVAFDGDEAAFEAYLEDITYTQMQSDGIIVTRKL